MNSHMILTDPANQFAFVMNLGSDIISQFVFDPARGGSYVRLSFAGPAGDIDEALRRMGSWLERR